MTEVTYVRGNFKGKLNAEFMPPANPGSDTEYMIVVQSADLKAILKGSSFGPVPTLDDQIIDGPDKYQPAVPLPGFSHYGYTKPDNVSMLIHLRKVS